MKRTSLLVLAFTLGAGRALVADEAATVTEAYNHVNYGPSASAASSPASEGTKLHDGEYLKTGSASRAAIDLPTKSIARLGANTIYNYSVADNQIDLQAGTILFCKPKENAAELHIKTAAVTAAIVGTTGFVSVHGKVYQFGLIEGHANAEAGGKTFEIGPGEILSFTPGKPPLVSAFDVPRFVRTTPLLHKFKGHLPNQKYIDDEVASYQDDERRGFIQPPNRTFDYSGEVPGLPTTAFDSAQNAQRGNPPPSQPATPPSGSGHYGG